MEHLEQRNLLAPLAVGMIPGDPAVAVVAPIEDFKVNAIDMLGARDNQTPFPEVAGITNVYDVNRDQRVNVTDMLLIRDNQTHFLDALQRITVPEEVVEKIARWMWQVDTESDRALQERLGW
jgi:hypothetical protein